MPSSRRKLLRSLGTALGVMAAGGCTSTGQPGNRTPVCRDPSISVRIRNDDATARSVHLRLTSDNGVELDRNHTVAPDESVYQSLSRFEGELTVIAETGDSRDSYAYFWTGATCGTAETIVFGIDVDGTIGFEEVQVSRKL